MFVANCYDYEVGRLRRAHPIIFFDYDLFILRRAGVGELCRAHPRHLRTFHSYRTLRKAGEMGRIDLTFFISYDSDIKKAKEIITTILKNNPKVL
jgi:hypothetical protein